MEHRYGQDWIYCPRCQHAVDVDDLDTHDVRGLQGVCSDCICDEDAPPDFWDRALLWLVWGCILGLFFVLCYFAGTMF